MLALSCLDESFRRLRPVGERETHGRVGLLGVGGRGFQERRGFVFFRNSSVEIQTGSNFCPTVANLRKLGQVSRVLKRDSSHHENRSPFQ